MQKQSKGQKKKENKETYLQALRKANESKKAAKQR